MNILTFDIEEWFLEKNYFGNRQEKYQAFDLYLNQILDKLEREQKKATFFCLGGMAREFPEVVRRIADKGHEIGCHSDQHVWITKLTEEEFRTDTISAIDALEQCIGEKVLSYRAPAFSIGNSNKWAFEILAECGIERDASIFPATRDFGGFANFGQKAPSIVKCGGVKIKEFPIVFYTENQLLTKSCPKVGSSRGTKMGQNLLKTYLAIFFHDVHVIKDLCYSFAKVHNYCETNEGIPLNLSFAVHFSSTCTDNGIFG